MATKIPKEEIQERFKRLPEDLREAIFSSEVAEILLSIGKKHAIHIDKLGELSAETTFVMLGVTHPRDFIPILEKTLGVSRDTARIIAQDVNMLVFSRIRESLKKLHNIADEEPIKEPVSGAPAFTQRPAPPPIPSSLAPEKKEFIGPTTPAWRELSPVKNSPPPGPSGAQSAGAVSNGMKKEAPAPISQNPAFAQGYGEAKPAWQDIKKEMEKQKISPEKIISAEPLADTMPAPEKKLEEELAPLLKTFPSSSLPAPEKKEISLPPKTEIFPPTPKTPSLPIAPPTLKPSSPFEEKVKDGVFREQPIESIKGDGSLPPPSSTDVVKITKEAEQKKQYPALDPYREPVDPKDLSPKKTNL